MGATASIELQKPSDASDILATDNLDFAKSEVIRLRKDLGHLAEKYGVTILSYDASDIVYGKDDVEDFHRCVREVSHIRQCLLLNTQSSKRRERGRTYQKFTANELENSKDADDDSNSDDSRSDDEEYKC